MEQNTTKFRLRFNLFDIIVLIIALVAGIGILLLGIRSQSKTGGKGTGGQIEYTILFQKMSAGNSQLIQAGDQLQDTVKNYKIGEVVSVEVKSAEVEILNQETQMETVERTLFLNGTIAEDSWFDDDVTPQMFKEELLDGSGDITVWINSPGGDCVAAAQIYNMLREYEGKVTDSKMSVVNSLMDKIAEKCKIQQKNETENSNKVKADSLMDRLFLMKNWR